MSPACQVLDVRGPAPTLAELEPALVHLRGDGLLAYPTETVYGFGGRCTPSAIARLQALKGRDPDKPFLVLAESAASLSGLRWTEDARELARLFWPGALTLVLADPERTFPDGVRSPAGAVAVRVSPHPLLRVLIPGLGEPVTSTSANAPGRPPARSGEEAASEASALEAGSEVLVLEAGLLPASGPSTILDCTAPRPRVVREGTLPVSRLRCALPELG